jgi:hypothetical protein
LDTQTRQEAREARVAAAKAAEAKRLEERRAEKKARRSERWSWKSKPIPFDRSVAWWVGGGIALLTASYCGIQLAKPGPAPYIVVQGAAQPAATQTSGPVSQASNPLAGFPCQVSTLAASVISGSDPNGETIRVKTPAGEIAVGKMRLENVAGQLWTYPGVDPTKVMLQSTDPRQPPVVKVPTADGVTPAGTPLFEQCAPATTTSVGPTVTSAPR